MMPTTPRTPFTHRSASPAASAVAPSVVVLLVMAAALTGCAGNIPADFGVGATTTATAATAVRLQGVVHGGNNPVSGATIQLYTVGQNGLKSASSSILIAAAPTTSSAGFFSLGNGSTTAVYSCPTSPADEQVYLVASGGNPGSGGTNSNLNMVAALGSCQQLLANATNPSYFITVNEITTVAAAYALAPFALDLTHIGATGANPANIQAAFANAALLANTVTGAPGPASAAAGVTVPTTELNELGNIMAACAASTSSTGSLSGNCNTLFTATGATETFGAMLAIAKNPGSTAITGLYTLPNGNVPFYTGSAYATRPNDFSMAVSMSGSSSGTALASPYAIAIDKSGNAWVTNSAGSSVNEFSPSGALTATLSPTGLYGAQGIAIDNTSTQNVWIANTAGNSIFVVANDGAGATTTISSSTASLSAPTAIAINSAGNAFVTNFNGTTVSGIAANGAGILANSPFPGDGLVTVPNGIAVDASGNVFFSSGNGTVEKLSSAGVWQSTLTDNTLQGPQGVAVDPSGDVLATGFTTGTSVAGALSEFTTGTTAAAASPASTGAYTPAGVATDGTNIWVANSGGLVQFTYGSATPVSSTLGYGGLSTPIGVAVDSTGSVWTTNSGSNTVSKFIGLAVPVTTPLAANVGP